MDPIVLCGWQRTENVDLRRKTKLCFGVCVLLSWMFLRSSFVLLVSAIFCDGYTAAWFQWLQEGKQERACGCDHDASHRGHVTLVSYQCDMIPVVSKINPNPSSRLPSAASTQRVELLNVAGWFHKGQCWSWRETTIFPILCLCSEIFAALTAAFLVTMTLTTPSLPEIDIFLLRRLFEDFSCFGAEHHNVPGQHFLFPKICFFQSSVSHLRMQGGSIPVSSPSVSTPPQGLLILLMVLLVVLSAAFLLQLWFPRGV